MSSRKNTPKIEDIFSDFEKSQLSSIEHLTINDILNNISPYRLIAHDVKTATEIIIQALDTIINTQQQSFFNSLPHSIPLSDIIEILGTRVQAYHTVLTEDKSKIVNKLSFEFMQIFCRPDGSIDWEKLVEWNSGNLDLDSFFAPTQNP